MTEHEDNRVHYLIDACEVRGHLDIKPDDLSLILIHQRELGKEDALAHLAEHDKAVRNKTIEECIRIAYTYDDRGFTVEDVKRITDGIVKQFEQMKEGN